MNLVPHNNVELNNVLQDFDFTNPPTDPEQLAVDLVHFMRSQDGVGLAANQLGLPYRVFVMEGEPAFACFNPKIIMPGSEEIILEEACLTFPGLYIKVSRPRDIKVRFNGPDGEVYTKTFTGMTARIFQHELDHLDGIFMHDHVSKLARDMAFKKWAKWKKTRK